MSGLLGTFIKQPAENLDYDVSFKPWIPEGDKVLSVVASADPGIVLGASIIDPEGLVVKQWISGGQAGETYKIQIRATTEDGRIKEAEFKIRMKEI